MAAADAAPVGGLELVGGLAAGQEGGEPGADRARAQIGTWRMWRSPSRSSHSATKRKWSLAHSIEGSSSPAVMIAAAIGSASR